MFKTKKIIRVKYASEFDEQLKQLRQIIIEKDTKFEKQLLKAIQREIENLRINPHRGIHIEKKKIPKKYIEKYDVPNLWKINLPNYWRMLYSILGNEIEIISVILEFMDHKQYNKIFRYKT